MLVNLAAVALCNFHLFAAWFFDDSAVGWDPISLWKQMGILAKVVVIVLFIMSGWSIGVMIDRWMAFNAARNQSRSFAPAVAGALREAAAWVGCDNVAVLEVEPAELAGPVRVAVG